MNRKGFVLIVVAILLMVTAIAALGLYNAVYSGGRIQGIDEVRCIRRYYAASSGLNYASLIIAGPSIPTSPIYLSTYSAASRTLHDNLGLTVSEDVMITINTPTGIVYPVTSTYTLSGKDMIKVTGNVDTSRFVVETAGTVTDRATGLQWEQKTDITTSINYCGNTYTWGDAFDVFLYGTRGLNRIDSGKGFAGHNDWRIPNVNELASIVDYTRFSPSINPKFSNTVGTDKYWSSTSMRALSGQRWDFAHYVSFSEGLETGYDSMGYAGKSSTFYVRAVRGGQGGIPR